MDRRSVLKLFGIGAVIAPVIRGVATADQAVIVKPPEVELVKAADIMPLDSFGDSDVVVFVRHRHTGEVHEYASAAIVLSRSIVDISHFSDASSSFVPTISEINLRLTGEVFYRGIREGPPGSALLSQFTFLGNYQGTRLRPAGGKF